MPHGKMRIICHYKDTTDLEKWVQKLVLKPDCLG